MFEYLMTLPSGQFNSVQINSQTTRYFSDACMNLDYPSIKALSATEPDTGPYNQNQLGGGKYLGYTTAALPGLGHTYLFTSLKTDAFVGTDTIKEEIFAKNIQVTRHAIDTLDDVRANYIDPKVYGAYSYYNQSNA